MKYTQKENSHDREKLKKKGGDYIFVREETAGILLSIVGLAVTRGRVSFVTQKRQSADIFVLKQKWC
jgi:hypothetical protein